MNIKESVLTSISICFIVLFFLLGFTWIAFDFQNSSSSLKDTWTIVSSLFSGIATLSAAYIAYNLYIDWRKPHNFTIETDHKKEILKVIRKIIPLENQFYRLLSNHFIYPDQPYRTIPINVQEEELKELTTYVNELLGLLDELFFITKDENITNLLNWYMNYAQLYVYILKKSTELYQNNQKKELVEFLRTRLEFEFTDINSKKWTSYTQYAYAFVGLDKVNLRKYISENLKSKDTYN